MMLRMKLPTLQHPWAGSSFPLLSRLNPVKCWFVPVWALVENISDWSSLRWICEDSDLECQQKFWKREGWAQTWQKDAELQTNKPGGGTTHTAPPSQSLLVMVQQNRCADHMFWPHVLTVSADLQGCSCAGCRAALPTLENISGTAGPTAWLAAAPRRPPSCLERCRCCLTSGQRECVVKGGRASPRQQPSFKNISLRFMCFYYDSNLLFVITVRPLYRNGANEEDKSFGGLPWTYVTGSW